MNENESLQGSFANCCIDTINAHSAHNHMLVCSECNDLIKLYLDPVAYRNYLRFCQTKDRNVIYGMYKEFSVIIVQKNSGKF